MEGDQQENAEYGGAIKQNEHELIVVMDEFGGEWSPFAVMTDAAEAIHLREMLSEDAEARCETAPYFEDKSAVRERETSEPPKEDEYHVTFSNESVHGLSDDDWAARELQCEEGGIRGPVTAYETAEEVVEDRPSAVGQFIVSQMTADDLLEVVQ